MSPESGVSTDLIVLKLNWGLTFYYLIVTRIKLFQVYLCYYALNAAEECQDYWGLFCRFLEGRTVTGELIGTDSGDRRGCGKQHSIFKQLQCALCVHSKIQQQKLEKKRIRYSYLKYERIPLVVTIVKSRLIPALFDKFI